MTIRISESEARRAGLLPGRKRKAKILAPFAVRLCITVPLKTQRTLNSRMHWASAARIVKAERAVVAYWLWECSAPGWLHRGRPFIITLTRLGGRKMDDDNLRGILKGCRDEVAKWLGLDDGDPRLTWNYAAEPGGPLGVRIELSRSEER